MSCPAVRDRLLDLVRQRLDGPGAAAVRSHLASCADCTRAEAAERLLDELLRERLPRHAVPAGLRARLGQPPAPAAPSRAHRARLLAPALAAGVALAVGAVGWLRSGPEAGDLEGMAAEAINDHLRVLAAQHPLEVVSGGPHQVKPWFEGKLDFAPDVPMPDVPDLQLRGGAVGYLFDRRAAVLSYALRLHAVTLLAFRASGLPALAGGPPEHLRTVSRRGFHAVIWRSGEVGYALVSDAAAGDLAGLARAMVQAPPEPPR